MNKYNYLHQLNQLLSPLETSERHHIMNEVEDKFKDVSPENIDTIIHELGRPIDYAKPILESRHLSLPVPMQKTPASNRPVSRKNDYIPPQQPMHASAYSPDYRQRRSFASGLLIALLLLFFNLIIVLGPTIAIISLDLGLLITGISSFMSGIVLIISGITGFGLSLISLPSIMLAHPTLYYAGAGVFIGLGGLLSIGIIATTRWIAILMVKYIQWNIRVIRGYS